MLLDFLIIKWPFKSQWLSLSFKLDTELYFFWQVNKALALCFFFHRFNIAVKKKISWFVYLYVDVKKQKQTKALFTKQRIVSAVTCSKLNECHSNFCCLLKRPYLSIVNIRIEKKKIPNPWSCPFTCKSALCIEKEDNSLMIGF